MVNCGANARPSAIYNTTAKAEHRHYRDNWSLRSADVGMFICHFSPIKRTQARVYGTWTCASRDRVAQCHCPATLSTLDDVVVIDGEEIVLFGIVISLVSIKQNHQEAKADSCPLPISISVGAWWVVYGQLRG